MKILAIIANVCVLVFLFLLMTIEGGEIEGWAIPFILSTLLAPILSIIALLLKGPAGKDWLSRYFARKALEENRKMAALDDKTSSAPASQTNSCAN